jgi:hypothetical protein
VVATDLRRWRDGAATVVDEPAFQADQRELHAAFLFRRACRH